MNIFKQTLRVFLILMVNHLQAQVPELVLQRGHDKEIDDIVFSQNGKYMLTVSADETGKIWEPYSGRLISELRGSNASRNKAYFDPESKYVMTYSYKNSTYYFWDPSTGKQLFMMGPKGEDNIESLEFNKKGTLFAISYVHSKSIEIHNAYTGLLIRTIKGFAEDPGYYQFLSNENLIVGSNQADSTQTNIVNHYYICDINKGKIILSKETKDGNINAVVADHTGKYFLVDVWIHGGQKVAQLWEINGLQWVWTKPCETIFMQFSPDDKKVLFSIDDVNNIPAFEMSVKDTSQLSYLNSKAFIQRYSPTGKMIATVTVLTNPADSSQNQVGVAIWDSSHNRNLRNFCTTGNRVSAFAFSPDEHFFVTGHSDGSYSVWDIHNIGLGNKISGNESVFDPMLQFHYDASSQKMIFTTNRSYYAKGATELSKALFVDVKPIIRPGTVIVDPSFKPINFSNDHNWGFRVHLNGLNIINNHTLSQVADLTGNDKEGKYINATDMGIVASGKTLQIPAKTETADQNISLESIVIPTVRATNPGSDLLYDLSYMFPDAKKAALLQCVLAHIQTNTGKQTKLISANTGIQPVYNADNNSYTFVIKDSIVIIDGSSFTVRDKFKSFRFYDPVISSNGKYVLGKTDFSDSSIICFDVTLKMGMFRMPFRDNQIGSSIKAGIGSATVSPDNKIAALTSVDQNNIQIIDAQSGQTLAWLVGHSGLVRGVEFTRDNQYLFSWSEDGTLKKWDAKKNTLLYTMLFFKDHEYAIILPDGYYYSSSRTNAKYLNFKLNNRIYNFSQFDLRYNRPDKVLQAIGSVDSNLIKTYLAVWEKRIKKSGNTEQDVNNSLDDIPDISIQSAPASSVTDKKEFRLSFKASGNKYFLNGYNVLINDVPLFGMTGKSLPAKQFTALLNESILLSEGLNKIEVICTNEKGIDSRKENLMIQYLPANSAKPKTWFIGIGINEYAPDTGLDSLHYCVKDIRDLTESLHKKYGDDFIADTLLDGKATKENIKALKLLLMKTGIEDRVIVSLNGHGMSYGQQNDFYFMNSGATVSDPLNTAISYADLAEILDSIPARKKLLLLDACHSGEADNDNTPASSSFINTSAATPDKNNADGTKQRGAVLTRKSQFVQPNASELFRIMKDAFVDIRRNNGAYVISAAQSNQTAGEQDVLANGLFSSCLLQYLKTQSHITINNLSGLVNQCVNEKSRGKQKISNRQELADINWELW